MLFGSAPDSANQNDIRNFKSKMAYEEGKMIIQCKIVDEGVFHFFFFVCVNQENLFGFFLIGQLSVPWLGPFDQLTSCKEYAPEMVYSDEEKKSPFPVRFGDKHSYAYNCVVWIKPSGLQVIYASCKCEKSQSTFNRSKHKKVLK